MGYSSSWLGLRTLAVAATSLVALGLIAAGVQLGTTFAEGERRLALGDNSGVSPVTVLSEQPAPTDAPAPDTVVPDTTGAPGPAGGGEPTPTTTPSPPPPDDDGDDGGDDEPDPVEGVIGLVTDTVTEVQVLDPVTDAVRGSGATLDDTVDQVVDPLLGG